MSAALFDLDPEGNAEQAQRIGNNLSIAPPEPTVFTGFGGAVGNHIMRAAANTGRTAAVLATAPAIAIEKATAGDNYSGNATPLSGPIFKAIDEVFNPAVDYWTPKASETGVAGRIVGGLVEGLAPLTLGPAGVPAMIGNAQVGTAVDLVNQGVDAGTAQQVGTAAGVANAVGFKMPFLGNSLVTRMGSGAAGNLVVNAGAAAVQGKTLEGNGYEKAAKQFDPLNPEARAIDLVLGAAFGILAHKGAPILPSQGDAALALRNAKNFQQDSAPGTPVDAASSIAHQNAMEQAMLALARGEKVNVADSIVDADFMKPPPMKETAVTTAVREAIVEMHPMTPAYPGEVASIVGKVRTEADMRKAAALTEPEIIWGNIEQRSDANLAELKAEIKRTKDPAALAILNEELVKVTDARAKSGTVATPQELAKLIPKADNLSPAHSAVESALRTKIANDYAGAKTQYAKIPDSEGGRIINTDIARELSPEYVADKTLSAAVHEPASWFVKEYYADRLAELPKGSDVLFTAGGGGAGKSSALDAIPEMRTANERAGLVFDTTMSRLQSSVDLVQRALDTGHNVKVVMVDRDPVEAFLHGVLPRAMGDGRTVPLNQVLAAHRDVPGVIRELQKRYVDNPKFSLSVVDNTRGKDKAALTSVDKLPQRDYNQIERAMHDALEQQYQSGSISEPVYRATVPAGSLQSLPPQRIPTGLPRSDGGPTGYPGASVLSDRLRAMESPNGRGNAQADPRAAAELPGNNQGAEGVNAQDGGVQSGVGGGSPASPGLRPAQDQAGGPVQGSAQLSHPPGELGNVTSAVTERGQRIALRYLVSEADTLITSHDNQLKVNPEFPAELQPRDRERAASEAQIAKIENSIQPELLGESPKASDGAPIIGQDGVVESGNARTIALRRAYDSGKADEYKQWLVDNADRFGVDRAAIEKMANPILTRIGVEPYDRAEFARQANESSVAAMSSTEMAKSDAARMPDLSELSTNDDGSINTTRSAGFVREFINKAVSPTERGNMMTAAGELSQDGMKRIRNAIFAKAYGDSEIVAMMSESMDANVKNILSGMMRAAPEVARLRDLVESGARHPMDIAPDLVRAVREFSNLRSEGKTVEQHLAQGSMFGDGLSPQIKTLMQGLQDNARAPKRIGEMISKFTDMVEQLGDPRQRGVFDDAAPQSHELMASTVNGMQKENASVVPATPEFAAMQKIAKDSPDTLVLDGYDADGNPRYTSMRDAAAQIEAEHAEAVKETKSYDAAVNCLLRRGG